VAHCTAQIVKGDLSLIEKIWYEDLTKKFEYKGKDDPSLTVIIFTVHYATLGNTYYEGVWYKIIVKF
jgi:general stress protein 26